MAEFVTKRVYRLGGAVFTPVGRHFIDCASIFPNEPLKRNGKQCMIVDSSLVNQPIVVIGERVT